MAKRKLNILIVEDDAVSQRLIQEILSPYGSCTIAMNGEEATKFFRRALDKKAPYDFKVF